MKIYNNTPNQAEYFISSATGSECGSIDPSQTLEFPQWDNQDNVTVSFIALPSQPEGSPFTVTIPESKTGMAVTMGLYQE